MTVEWTHLIRFIAKEDGQTHLGQIDATLSRDVGTDLFEGKTVKARIIKGSIYDGVITSQIMTVGQVSS